MHQLESGWSYQGVTTTTDHCVHMALLLTNHLAMLATRDQKKITYIKLNFAHKLYFLITQTFDFNAR